MCDARRNEMRSTTLYALSYPAVSASEAMRQVKEVGQDTVRPFVLAYTPDFCGFVDWREDEGGGDRKFFSLNGGKTIENLFELRCFCPTFELRWVREGTGEKGRAALLSESSMQGAEEKKDISALDGRYLLWGRGVFHFSIFSPFSLDIGLIHLYSLRCCCGRREVGRASCRERV